jgi:hypothetical protein
MNYLFAGNLKVRQEIRVVLLFFVKGANDPSVPGCDDSQVEFNIDMT